MYAALQRRGVATFPEGVPEPPGTLRMIWSARGVRVGISSISRTQCFWFTTLTCPEVCPCALIFNPKPSQILHPLQLVPSRPHLCPKLGLLPLGS